MMQRFFSGFAARDPRAWSPPIVGALLAGAAAAMAGCPGVAPQQIDDGAGGKVDASGSSSSSGRDVSSATGTGGAGDGGRGEGGVCPEGFTECDDGVCVDTLHDPKNCGACDRRCSKTNVDLNIGPACNEGLCRPKCLPGFIDDNSPAPPKEDDGCETVTKRVFVTSTPSPAFVGQTAGIPAADDFCEGAAQAAGLDGNWKAWLSDAQASPSTTFDTSFEGAYVLLDGKTVVARTWVGLTTPPLDHAIDMDESGGTQNAFDVWTATLPDGTPSGSDCAGWTTDLSEDGASHGTALFTDQRWTQNDGATCDNQLHVYCFEH
jgi:hypothetical protein